MQLSRSAFDRIGEDVLDMGAIDESVLDHFVDRVWFDEILEHRLVTASDDQTARVWDAAVMSVLSAVMR